MLKYIFSLIVLLLCPLVANASAKNTINAWVDCNCDDIFSFSVILVNPNPVPVELSGMLLPDSGGCGNIISAVAYYYDKGKKVAVNKTCLQAFQTDGVQLKQNEKYSGIFNIKLFFSNIENIISNHDVFIEYHFNSDSEINFIAPQWSMLIPRKKLFGYTCPVILGEKNTNQILF